MKITTSQFIRNHLKHFGFTKELFRDFLNGNDGKEKQLFALVFKSLPAQFIAAFVHNEEFFFLREIEYLTDKDIHNFFGWRKHNIQNWKSKEKKLLRKLLLATPKCFVIYEQAHLATLESLQVIFPKNLPKEEVCKSCLLFGECVGNKKYRKEDCSLEKKISKK